MLSLIANCSEDVLDFNTLKPQWSKNQIYYKKVLLSKYRCWRMLHSHELTGKKNVIELIKLTFWFFYAMLQT